MVGTLRALRKPTPLWRHCAPPYPSVGTLRTLRKPIPPSHEEGLKFIQKQNKKQGQPSVFCLCVSICFTGEGCGGACAPTKLKKA